jgi:hypothetical protein
MKEQLEQLLKDITTLRNEAEELAEKYKKLAISHLRYKSEVKAHNKDIELINKILNL